MALDPDIVLYLSATATDSSGAIAEITARVHTTTTWDDVDPSAAIRSEFIASACAPQVDATEFESDSWAFALVDLGASVQGGGEWPEGLTIEVFPQGGEILVAAGGIVVVDPLTSAADGLCTASNVIAGAGDGTMVLGFADDGDLSAWTAQTFGFHAGADVQLSACTFLATPAAQVASPDSVWKPTSTSAECTVSA